MRGGEVKRSETLRADNARYLWHPMAHPRQMQEHPPIIVERGDGVWITDVDGHRVVDGVGGLWNINLGYGREEIKRAIVEQLDELAYYSCFRGTTHPRAIELSARLVSLLAPEGMSRIAFSSGGSDAVESALKIARQYWKLVGQADRHKFIALKQGYHGVHFGGMSVNGNTSFRRAYEPLLPGCFHIDTPWTYRNPYTDDPLRLGEICAELLDREIRFQGPDTVAAFIAEPVQGAGGVVVPPSNFWPLVREVCDRHGVLLIADEVVTGFGRTGSWFGSRLWGVRPDLMCLAKGINSGYVPLGATAVGERVAAAFLADESGSGALMHGYTYSGHPVACASALAALDILERENVVENARVQGEHLMSRLAPLVERFDAVGDVRGIGLMACVELVADKANRTPLDRKAPLPAKVAEHAYRNGAMVRVSGGNLILSPPLVIQREQVDVLVDAIEGALVACSA